MDQRTLETLELESLIGLLAAQIRTPLGRRLLDQLQPSIDLVTINTSLDQTSECVAYFREGGTFDLSDVSEPGQALDQLHIEGARLDPDQILTMERLIAVGMDLRGQFRSSDQSERYPLLSSISFSLPDLGPLVKSISGKILPNGEVDDNASPELRRIRRQINSSRARIYSSLESIMREKEVAIQDEVVTVRNGRFVIPVRTDSRGQVTGVVHGLSSSGVTSYVEPMTVIEQNNDLVRLREQEEIEIANVLFSISAALREHASDIRAIAVAVGKIDAIQARAKLSIQLNCTRPHITDFPVLLLEKARHPLLEHRLRRQGAASVPISLELDEGHQVLVISGPNAGGKTVTLKTVGLIALMAQMGLHVPAEAARLPVFEQIFADIGDQQSIAANLSTFTAHIRNLAEMIAKIKPPALLLIDEAGTGTDPDEGAALGIAVVDYFRTSGAKVITTTHYNKLKVWASQTEGVLNASVEFDEETLSPTYRLITGVAGASSGLEIARRMGLQEPLIRQARLSLDLSHEQANQYLKRLKSLVDEQEAGRAALEEEREATAQKYARLDVEFAQRENDRRARFESELARVMDDFKAESDRLIKGIGDKAIAARLKRDAEDRLADLRHSGARLRKQAGSAAGSANRPADVKPSAFGEPAEISSNDGAQAAASIRERDIVLISSLGQQGKVESVDGDTYTVAVGSLKYRARRGELQLAKAAEPVHPRHSVSLPSRVTADFAPSDSFSSELNVIGNNVDDATDRVDKFLDEAFLAGAETVRIIHGHGKGALRQAISKMLTGHPHVENFSLAPPAEGGAGATIANLKK
jgi:DNA mismatch repair protein MutS2